MLTSLRIAVLLLAAGATAQAQRDRSMPRDSVTRIVAQPDYLVSRDGDAPHIEVMAAANPRRQGNLMAGAITYKRPEGGTTTKAYVTQDGGKTWSDVAF